MKQPAKHQNQPQPDEQADSEYSELCNAATKIQASFRGHMTRKQLEKKENDTEAENHDKNQEEELDIDLSDPEMNKAAAKIQASFRGHLVRKGDEEKNKMQN